MARKKTETAPPPQPTPWRIRFWKIAFALAVQLIALAATYTTSFEFFRPADVSGILTAALAVNAVLLLPALFLPSWPHLRLLADLYLVLVMLLGIFSAHIMHTAEFAEQDYVLIGGTMLLVAFTLFIALRIIEQLHYGGMLLNAAALTGIATVVTTTAMTRRDFLQSVIATVTAAMTQYGFLQPIGRIFAVFGVRSDSGEGGGVGGTGTHHRARTAAVRQHPRSPVYRETEHLFPVLRRPRTALVAPAVYRAQ